VRTILSNPFSSYDGLEISVAPPTPGDVCLVVRQKELLPVLGARVDLVAPKVLALVARRLSLDQAEYLTGLKSESIGKHLTPVIADPNGFGLERLR
jgi:hypothetical protein